MNLVRDHVELQPSDGEVILDFILRTLSKNFVRELCLTSEFTEATKPGECVVRISVLLAVCLAGSYIRGSSFRHLLKRKTE